MPVRPGDTSVITRYEPAVRRFCRARTRSAEDADDAVQDTFLRYLRRSDKVIRNDEAWLITAASRACADINRRHTREDQRLEPLTDSESADKQHLRTTGDRFNPERLTVEQLTIADLLRRMTPRERLVVTHLYLLGADTAKVARYLGVTPEHLRVIAMRARRHARHHLRTMESTPAT